MEGDGVTATAKLIDKVKDADAGDCDAIAAQATAAIRRREMLILRLVEEAQGEIRAFVDGWKVPDTEEDARRELTDAAVALFQREMKDVFATAQAGIGDLRGEVAKSRAILADWHRESQAGLVRARGRVEEAAAQFLDFEVISPERLKRAFAQLDAAVEGIEGEALDLLDESRQRLGIELSTAARALGARITTVAARALPQVEAAPATLKERIEGVAARATDAVGRLPGAAEIDALAERIPNTPESLGDLKRALGELGTGGSAEIDALKADTEAAILTGKEGALAAVADAESGVSTVVDAAQERLERLAEEQEKLLVAIDDAAGELADELAADVRDVADRVRDAVDRAGAVADGLLEMMRDGKAKLDGAVEVVRDDLVALSRQVSAAEALAHGAVDSWFERVETGLAAMEAGLPDAVRMAFREQVLNPVVDAFVERVDWRLLSEDRERLKDEILLAVDLLRQQVSDALGAFTDLGEKAVEEAKALCNEIFGFKDKVIGGVEAYLKEMEAVLKGQADSILGKYPEFDSDKVDALVAEGRRLLHIADTAVDEVNEAADHVRAYVDRGAELLGEFGEGGAEGLPGNVLKLASFASTAPEVAALRAGSDRLRILADEAREVLESQPVKMGLARLGDLAKSLGLDFDSDRFGDVFNILPTRESLNKLIPDFGGINLDGLLGDVGVGDDLARWVRVTHDLDVKAGRAWIRADVDIQLAGRERLFTLGPVTLFGTRSHLSAWLRAEATKDSERIAITDRAELVTDLEAVVGGQTMVTLKAVTLRYSSDNKLDVIFDPKRIKVHKNLRFIQDTLGSILGDSIGGLTILKDNGVPVGVEHRFSLPPISLNFLTSGVQNISISNRFALRALPDFVISNRFNLSTVDQPFIFAIFIIGGTGYVQVDAEYRPFDERMLVAVEFGAGGSASLAFSLGPVAGGVFITLSVTIRYAKRIGYADAPDTESGLTVSLVLVIAGHVSLWGMVTIYLGLCLSISYHDSGRVDAMGVLSVELRISRFIKLKFRVQARYKLRDGRSETSVSSQTTAAVTDERAQEALEKLKKLDAARKSL